MLSSQHLLRHLPVPTLQESVARYLAVARPLMNDEEFEITKRKFTDFVDSELATELQTHIKKRATEHENWLHEWWLKGAYLEYRDPLVLFSSPSYYCPPQKFSCPEDQFRFAAALISVALDYRARVMNHEIKPEVVGRDRTLCMDQYTKMFGGYRIPLIPCDQLTFPDITEKTKTVDVIIAYRNSLFHLEVDSAASDPQSIFDLLITLNNLTTTAATLPVGIMTAWHRDKWADAYQRLEKFSDVNAEILKVIRRSAFVLCLDTETMKPEGQLNNNLTRSFDNVLHGGGSSLNTGNRWFDKSVQFCVTPDGLWGFCQEHTPLDAPPTITMIDHIASVLIGTPGIWQNVILEGLSGRSLKKLQFELNPDLENSILEAIGDTDKIIDDMETHVQVCTSWGREDAKKHSIAADSLLQVALQVGYYRIHGAPACCYETGSTRRFLLGRTDTIRPCSVESLALCQELTSEFVQMDKARELLIKALKTHQEYSAAVLNGHGFDRHFFGLKRSASELGIDLKIFKDKGYQKTMHHLLSTSQASGPFADDAGLGYGPLQLDGYGCCYNIRAHRINLMISAWRSCPSTDPHCLGKSIADALAQLYHIATFQSQCA